MSEKPTIIYSDKLPISDEDLRVLRAWRRRVAREGIEFLERRRAERERRDDPPQRSA
jgi:hypothetical protein